MFIAIDISNSKKFKAFYQMCTKMKDDIGISPMNCFNVNVDLTKPVILNIPQKVTQQWIDEIKKFGY